MLRTTVIVKTDWVSSTAHLRRMGADELSQLLHEHKQLVARIVMQHDGAIIKGEGDAFWITFPSVTTAALAAVTMQREVRATQLGRPDDERLAMRVSIAVGDLLHRDNDMFGVAMSLAARMDGITPGDEIYLSHAAYLLVNHAQVKTAFVDAPILKGFDDPEPIYRVLQDADILVESSAVVVATDIGGFTRFVGGADRHVIARVLSSYEGITIACCAPLGGKLRSMSGDLNLITFDRLENALTACEALISGWEAFMRENDLALPLRIGVHLGDCYVFRTYLFGETINHAVIMSRVSSNLKFDTPEAVVVSGAVADALRGTRFARRLLELTAGDLSKELSPASFAAVSRGRAYLLQQT